MTTALLAPPATRPVSQTDRPVTQTDHPESQTARPVSHAAEPATTEQPTQATRTTAAAWKRPLAQVSRWTVRLILLLAVAVFAGLAIGPHVLGYRTMTMLTGSMAPVIDPGDVTIVTPLPTTDIRPGMIINYHIPIDDHRLVSHRVLSTDVGPDGAVTIATKGDANDAADPWKATLQGHTAWQVRAVIPALGHAIETLRTPIVSQALVYGAPTLLAGWLLLSIWRPARTHDDDDDTRPDTQDDPR